MMLTVLVFIYLFELSSQHIVKLSVGDIKEIITISDDTWLLSIQESITNKFKDIDVKYLGMFRVGYMTREHYIKDQTADVDETVQFIIYPYGSAKQKRTNQRTAKTVNEAIRSVLQSIPDHTITLPNNIDGKNERLRGFFNQAYETTPTRFPVAYFTDSDETPVELKILALKYSSLFLFGIIKRPELETQTIYAIEKIPHFTGFIVDQLKEAIQPRIKKIQFVQSIHGPLKFPFLVRFLYLLHKYHFSELPYATINKSEIDLDALFFDDVERFRDLYLITPLGNKKSKNEL